jgi:hypothetical protein
VIGSASLKRQSAASIRDAKRLRDISVLATDHLKDLGLNRLRLFLVFIELKDKFAIKLSSEAVDCFLEVGDIALLVQSREMTPYDHGAANSRQPSVPDVGVRNYWRRDRRTRRNSLPAIVRLERRIFAHLTRLSCGQLRDPPASQKHKPPLQYSRSRYAIFQLPR